jgi:valyl-tRNA synthetase
MSDESAPLAKNYDPSALESRWYQEWTDRGYFHGDATAPKAPFSIAIPPPNVTGFLHMGHALGSTIQDILTRWRRMSAYNAMWLPGTDHAGIATQMVVERNLKREEGKTRHDLGREAFVKKIWEWRKQSGDRILDQLKGLGCSLDWERNTFTLDDGYSAAVVECFVRLHEEGLIYRDKRLINWCVSCNTALSDLEVEHNEGAQGELYEFAYPYADGSGEIVVATTRVETMLGDTAIAVHPDDERYTKRVGQMVKHPLVDREFSVIADEMVDREFGTGAVKITPAHDPNDFECGKRHKLEVISMLNENGTVSNVGGAFAGMDRFEARKAVKARLRELGLERGGKPITHSVGHCQRCNTIVEPLVSTQWFVKMQPLAEPAIKAVEDGKIKFVPDTWTKTYYNWMTNIRDWCISRQLWWGHRIPAWHCKACEKITVARSAPDACKHCGAAASELKQDEDVLDTWFSSWLWPFATLGWPAETRELNTFYPTTVMETGYDILFFWVARMIMAGMHFMGKVPFRYVYLHSLVTDEKGQKMSKVKGNVIDPMVVIEQHGADALRFALAWLTTNAAQGKNIKFSMSNVEDARRFANKIWNACRFVLMNLEGFDADRYSDIMADGLDGVELDLPERWLLSRVQRKADEVHLALDDFRFQDSAHLVYHFIWDEICDWGIELAKARLADETLDATSRLKIQGVLVYALESAMRLLHPFMPFITEEIWQKLPKSSSAPQSIMITMYPIPDSRFADEASETSMMLLQSVIAAVRSVRTERQIPRAQKSKLVLTVQDDYKKTILDGYKHFVMAHANCDDVQVRRSGETPKGPTTVVMAGDVEVTVLLGAPADAGAERARIEKELAKAKKDVDFYTKRLGNEKFVQNAAPEVIAKDRAALGESQAAMTTLQRALEHL